MSGVPVDAAEKHAAPAQARSPNSLGAGPFPPMGPGSASETPTQAGPRRHGPSHVPPLKEQAAGWVPSAAMLVPVLSGVRSGSLHEFPGGQWT